MQQICIQFCPDLCINIIKFWHLQASMFVRTSISERRYFWMLSSLFFYLSLNSLYGFVSTTTFNIFIKIRCRVTFLYYTNTDRASQKIFKNIFVFSLILSDLNKRFIDNWVTQEKSLNIPLAYPCIPPVDHPDTVLVSGLWWIELF